MGNVIYSRDAYSETGKTTTENKILPIKEHLWRKRARTLQGIFGVFPKDRGGIPEGREMCTGTNSPIRKKRERGKINSFICFNGRAIFGKDGKLAAGKDDYWAEGVVFLRQTPFPRERAWKMKARGCKLSGGGRGSGLAFFPPEEIGAEDKKLK